MVYQIDALWFYCVKPTHIYNLPCADNFKTFNGKAKVIECKQGRYLQSYHTAVCFLSNDGKFEKLWGGYSVTTMKHIKSFMAYVGLPCGGKSWWDSLPTNNTHSLTVV